MFWNVEIVKHIKMKDVFRRGSSLKNFYIQKFKQSSIRKPIPFAGKTRIDSRTKLKAGMGVSHPSNLENLLFCRAKTAVKCTFAGQYTGSKNIGELL